MIETSEFYDALRRGGIDLFVGVPDSLLSSLCAYIDDNSTEKEHIITANEGNAVAVAAGYHLSSGRYAAVYMQNSGLGNTINPLTSLTDPEVYRIPMLLIIGWRGEPGVKDEPQHVKQGRITCGQLDLLEIPYQIVDADSNAEEVVSKALQTLSERNAPVALVVRKDAFTPYKSKRKLATGATLSREDALRCILELARDALVVSTTGKTSREVFELRVARNEPQRDFLTVGSMGHTSSIALGVALGNPARRVVCLDGDGSLLMHMGALPVIGSRRPVNLVHVLLNNAAHESVGGQPTVAGNVDFEAIARASGYVHYAKARTIDELKQAWADLGRLNEGPSLLEVMVSVGSRPDLGRPTSTPEENKQAFIEAARA